MVNGLQSLFVLKIDWNFYILTEILNNNEDNFFEEPINELNLDNPVPHNNEDNNWVSDTISTVQLILFGIWLKPTV